MVDNAEYTGPDVVESPQPAPTATDTQTSHSTFELDDLVETGSGGGSSKLYYLGTDLVVKEKLSDSAKEAEHGGKNKIAAHIPGVRRIAERLTQRRIEVLEKSMSEEEKVISRAELERRAYKLNNNSAVLKEYFGDAFMQAQFIVRDNKNEIPAIFCIQKRLPKGFKFLNKKMAESLPAEAKENLKKLLEQTDRLRGEKKLMFDILILENIAYDESTQQFFLFDVDPMFAVDNSPDHAKYELEEGDTIDNKNFKTVRGKQSNSIREVTDENLAFLQSCAA